MSDGLERGNGSLRHRRISGGRFSRKYVCVCKPGKGGVGRVGLVCDTDCRPSLFLIGHFRVPKNLAFKTRLSAKPLL